MQNIRVDNLPIINYKFTKVNTLDSLVAHSVAFARHLPISIEKS